MYRIKLWVALWLTDVQEFKILTYRFSESGGPYDLFWETPCH